jgi:hypothetical protein
VLCACAACYFVLPSRRRRCFVRMADGVVNALMCAASPAVLEWSLLLACCSFLWASHGLASSNWELAWARQAPTIMRQPLGVGQRGHDGGVHALHASPAVLRCELRRLPSHSHTHACMHTYTHTFPLACCAVAYTLSVHTPIGSQFLYMPWQGGSKGPFAAVLGREWMLLSAQAAFLPRMGLLWTAGCWLDCYMDL